MTKVAMLVFVAAISLVGQIQAAAADEVPKFDIRKSCKADIQSYPNAPGNVQGCLTDEQNAQTTLVSQWTQFSPESRTRCTNIVNNPGGPQSYVELLTCLQMARDVKGLPKE
jgi:hypothetical protein